MARIRQDGITLYTVYNNITDMPVVIDGTARKCASAMGVKYASFFHLYRDVNCGRVKKWTIYKSGVLRKRKETDLDKGISKLNMHILRTFAESKMSAKTTAEREYLTLEDIYYHLGKFRKKYGLNPVKKAELEQLIKKFEKVAI